MSEAVRRDDSAIGITRRAFVLFFALLPGWLVLALPLQLVAARVDDWILGGAAPFEASVDPLIFFRLLALLIWRAGVWSVLAVPLVRAAVAAESGAAPSVWPYVLAPDVRRFARVAWSLVVLVAAVCAGILLFVIPGIYLGLRLSLAPIAAAASDDHGTGLGDGWMLARGRLLHILGTFLAATVPVLAISAPFWIVASATGNAIVDMTAKAVASCLGEVTTVALTLIYLRVLQERSLPRALTAEPLPRSSGVFE